MPYFHCNYAWVLLGVCELPPAPWVTCPMRFSVTEGLRKASEEFCMV